MEKNIDIVKLKQSTQKLKVLFVEGSLSDRRTIEQLLNQFFEFIDIAEDASVALDMYRHFYNENECFYDIVFTDLEMQVVDDKELSCLLLDFHPNQEIVVLSGVQDFKVIVELLNIGVKKFISKPIDIDELKHVLSGTVNSLRKKQLQKEDINEVELYNQYLKERDEENKLVLEAKVKQLQEFSNALDLSAIVAKTDNEGRIIYVNDSFCNLSGYTSEELIGKNHRILNSGQRISSYYKKLYNTIFAKKTYKTIFENRNKNGVIYYVETTINPILNIDGEIVEFIAVSHDMTRLMNSIESAKSAQKSKENFFINISHEMKTPLNSILGFSSLLQKRVKDDAKSLMMVNTVLETGTDLSNLVDSIIDIRKIQEKSLVLKEFLFNPEIDISKSLEKYIDAANSKDIDYRIHIDKSIPKSLSGDIVRINQVISIIIDNAIKFTKKKGKVEVNIFYDTYNFTLICSVKDNGIGIAKVNQEKVFGLEQLDASADRSHEGSGIGLNLASNIIKIMKGSIQLKSIPERGSLFTLEFPLSNC